jgi:hypothetical protein
VLEVPSTVAFFVSYGAACVIASHLQYRLAYLYAATFDDPRSASLPRVKEKFNEAFDREMTIGKLWARLRERQTRDVQVVVDVAVWLRNYLAHLFVWDTRAEQGSDEGLDALAKRLDVGRDYLLAVGEVLHERHHALLVEAGATQAQIAEFSKPWDELGQSSLHDMRIPAAQERIVWAWRAPHEVADSRGERIYLENDTGAFWQLNENGLTECEHITFGSEWSQVSEIQQHLPAEVTARPSRKSNPAEWRGAFNYDLRFSSGVELTLEKPDGADVVSWSMKPRKARREAK